MTILGVDLSSKAIDFVLLDDEDNHADWLHFAGPKLDKNTKYPEVHYARHFAREIPGRAADFWMQSGVWLVAMEELWSHSRHTLRLLASIKGAVGACIPPGLRVVDVPPWEWKRHTTGRSSASKSEVKAWAMREWVNRTGFENQDAFDAYAIARAVRTINDRAEPLEAA